MLSKYQGSKNVFFMTSSVMSSIELGIAMHFENDEIAMHLHFHFSSYSSLYSVQFCRKRPVEKPEYRRSRCARIQPNSNKTCVQPLREFEMRNKLKAIQFT